MRIGGLQEFSLIDYPGKMAAVIFTQGCPLRCGFCHNSELVLPEKYEPVIEEDQIFWFLKKRVGRLEAVVVTGGEPTVQGGLISFLLKVKDLGYLVKLDTNGINPDVLREVIDLGLADYVAMDIKASEENYSKLANVHINFSDIQKSIRLIIDSGIPHEFRTTLIKSLHVDAESEIIKILSLIEGARKFRIQRFVGSQKVIDPGFLDQEHFSDDEIKAFQAKWGRDHASQAV